MHYKCEVCEKDDDTQEHALTCEESRPFKCWWDFKCELCWPVSKFRETIDFNSLHEHNASETEAQGSKGPWSAYCGKKWT